ncbi:MAG: glycerophosphodiester phosphodiesterase family protein [Acidimicrobiales bacterium]
MSALRWASIAVLAHRGSPDRTAPAVLSNAAVPSSGDSKLSNGDSRPGMIKENTVAAFVEALRLGADGVELDVRLGADGALVVHHDPYIDGVGLISELMVGDLPEWVPLLGLAIDACGAMTVNIELKTDLSPLAPPLTPDPDPDQIPDRAEGAREGIDRLVRQVVDAVNERGARGRSVVSSFSLSALDAIRAIDPRIPTGWLTRSHYDQVQALACVIDRGHSALHPPGDVVTSELVARAHDQGVDVCTWTVDDPSRMVELASMGVDSLITNDVAAALRTLRRS